MEQKMINVMVVNNDGGGFAESTKIPEGTTVRNLFGQIVADSDPNDYRIKVNGGIVAGDYVMQSGDRASFTPMKIEGA